MIRTAIVFFLVGLLAMFLGLYGIAGLSLEIGRLLLVVFLVLGVLSLLASVIVGRKPPDEKQLL